MNKQFINDNYRLQEPCHLLVWVDGCWNQELSDLQQLPNSVVLCDLSAARIKYNNLLTDTTASNSNTANAGYFLYVPEEASITIPIHLLFISSKDSTKPHCFSNLIVSKCATEINLVEEFISTPNAPGKDAPKYANQITTRMVINNKQQLNYCKIQRESANATHLSQLEISQHQGSTLNLKFLTLGAKVTQEHIEHAFLANGAIFTGDGLYVLKEKQKYSYNLHISHLIGECTSNVLCKGIMHDAAQGNFAGKITVVPNAKHSETHLTNKNLLLSAAAGINTKPELEIYTDDVKCSHGAAVGQLDPTALFYLRARGIDENRAKILLLQGFAQEILDKFPTFLTAKVCKHYHEHSNS